MPGATMCLWSPRLRPSNQHQKPTCFAHAYAAIIFWAWTHRGNISLHRRKNFIDLFEKLYPNSAHPEEAILYVGTPSERQNDDGFHQVVEELGFDLGEDYYDLPPLQCTLIEPEAVVVSKSLFVWPMRKSRWVRFEAFFADPSRRSNTLTKTDLEGDDPSTEENPIASHAIVIDWSRSGDGRICAINSWGEAWGDEGCFYVASLDVLAGGQLYDVRFAPGNRSSDALLTRDENDRIAIDSTIVHRLTPTDVVTGLPQTTSSHYRRPDSEKIVFLNCSLNSEACVVVHADAVHELPCTPTDCPAHTTKACVVVRRPSCQFIPELNVSLQHPNLTRPIAFRKVSRRVASNLSANASFNTLDEVDVLYEKANDGVLKNVVDTLTNKARLEVLRDVACAVAYLSGHGWAHRNIDDTHIVRSGTTWKLCSFRHMSISSDAMPLPADHKARWGDGTEAWLRGRMELDLYCLGRLIGYLNLRDHGLPNADELQLRCYTTWGRRCTAQELYLRAQRALEGQPYHPKWRERVTDAAYAWVPLALLLVYTGVNVWGCYKTLSVALYGDCHTSPQIMCFGAALWHVLNVIAASYLRFLFHRATTVRHAPSSTPQDETAVLVHSATPAHPLLHQQQWSLKMRLAFCIQVLWTLIGLGLGIALARDSCSVQFRWAGGIIVFHWIAVLFTVVFKCLPKI